MRGDRVLERSRQQKNKSINDEDVRWWKRLWRGSWGGGESRHRGGGWWVEREAPPSSWSVFPHVPSPSLPSPPRLASNRLGTKRPMGGAIQRPSTASAVTAVVLKVAAWREMAVELLPPRWPYLWPVLSPFLPASVEGGGCWREQGLGGKERGLEWGGRRLARDDLGNGVLQGPQRRGGCGSLGHWLSCGSPHTKGTSSRKPQTAQSH